MSQTIRVCVPARFYDDHLGRGLPSGVEVSRSSRGVVVELDRNGFIDLRSDAEFYWSGGVAEFGRDMFGLIRSAAAGAVFGQGVLTSPPCAGVPYNWLLSGTNRRAVQDGFLVGFSVRGRRFAPKILAAAG